MSAYYPLWPKSKKRWFSLQKCTWSKHSFIYWVLFSCTFPILYSCCLILSCRQNCASRWTEQSLMFFLKSCYSLLSQKRHIRNPWHTVSVIIGYSECCSNQLPQSGRYTVVLDKVKGRDGISLEELKNHMKTGWQKRASWGSVWASDWSRYHLLPAGVAL